MMLHMDLAGSGFKGQGTASSLIHVFGTDSLSHCRPASSRLWSRQTCPSISSVSTHVPAWNTVPILWQ